MQKTFQTTRGFFLLLFTYLYVISKKKRKVSNFIAWSAFLIECKFFLSKLPLKWLAFDGRVGYTLSSQNELGWHIQSRDLVGIQLFFSHSISSCLARTTMTFTLKLVPTLLYSWTFAPNGEFRVEISYHENVLKQTLCLFRNFYVYLLLFFC